MSISTNFRQTVFFKKIKLQFKSDIEQNTVTYMCDYQRGIFQAAVSSLDVSR
jgi:hypothetical protein